MSSQQAIDVKLAPGLLTALRGPKLWASLTAATGVISFDNTVGLMPIWNGAAVDDNGEQDAYLVNNVDIDAVGLATVFNATTGKFIFPLACVNTHLTNGNGVPIILTDWWTDKFPSAVSEDLLTAHFTLIVKNGAEQAYSMVTVHRLPSTVVVNSVTEQPPDPDPPGTPTLTLTGASVVENINDGLPTIASNTPVVITPTFPSGHSAVFGVTGYNWDQTVEIENPVYSWEIGAGFTVVSGTPYTLTIGPQSFNRTRVFVTMIVTRPDGETTTLIQFVIVET